MSCHNISHFLVTYRSKSQNGFPWSCPINWNGKNNDNRNGNWYQWNWSTYPCLARLSWKREVTFIWKMIFSTSNPIFFQIIFFSFDFFPFLIALSFLLNDQPMSQPLHWHLFSLTLALLALSVLLILLLSSHHFFLSYSYLIIILPSSSSLISISHHCKVKNHLYLYLCPILCMYWFYFFLRTFDYFHFFNAIFSSYYLPRVGILRESIGGSASNSPLPGR